MSNSNTSQLYSANFDDTLFHKNKLREMNRLSEDACYNNQKNISNNKKLKFVTTNHIDLLEARDKFNFFGYSVKDQLFVPGEKIDTYSNLLNGQNGQMLTNCNVRNGFGALPMPTTPFRGQLHHGDVTIEDSIRNNVEVKQKACLPREADFQKRVYNIFDDSNNIPLPQAIHSVERPAVGFNLGRNGIATRFTQKFNTDYNSSGTDFKPHSS
jgi:hypothetical protein